jgi:type II secretory pathway pseudopilin PulG
MLSTRVSWDDDAGETLVEVLVGLVILSIAAVAVLTAVGLSSRVSDMNRKQTTSGAYVKSFAEGMQKALSAGEVTYTPCAGANSYRSAALSQFTIPPGFSINDFQQAGAKPLDGAGATGTTSPCSDTGVQQVLLTVSSADGRAAESLVVVLRRPCNVGASCPS